MKKWYERIPHPVVMLFGIIILVTILSYVIPAGAYEREEIDGRQRVVANSYQTIEATPVSFLEMFKAFPKGFKTASNVIYVVFAGGIMFGILERSRMIENTVGTVIHKLGLGRKFLLVFLLTYFFGLFGVIVGYEHNIAIIPIAAVLSLALGGDLMLAAGMSVGAITIGFGLSPINPYTVGIGHQIAQMPLFSGAILRSILCFTALGIMAWVNVRYFKRILQTPDRSLTKDIDASNFKLSKPLQDYTISPNDLLVLILFVLGIIVMLYGIFEQGWYLEEISAIFLIIAIVCAIASRMKGNEIGETILKSVAVVAPGAFMIGYATTIKEIMEMGNISDTISYTFASWLSHLPTYLSAVFMSLSQSVINFLIPSGSGQALATLPIMIPVGEILGLTRQTAILAFQIGDGVTNLFNPTLGGLIAMLSMCKVPFDRWLRFIFPVALLVLLVAWGFLLFSVLIGWGPA